MLLSKRHFLLGLAALGGCGFEPVYGTGGTANALRGNVQMDAPRNRDEFRLNEQLELRLGRSVAPKYGLSVTLATRIEALAISGSNDISRFNFIGSAAFTLRDLATGQAVFSDEVDTFTAFSASAQPVATLAAQRDAQARLSLILADEIVTQLLLNADQL